jgi:hypothetical protein
MATQLKTHNCTFSITVYVISVHFSNIQFSFEVLYISVSVLHYEVHILAVLFYTST